MTVCMYSSLYDFGALRSPPCQNVNEEWGHKSRVGTEYWKPPKISECLKFAVCCVALRRYPAILSLGKIKLDMDCSECYKQLTDMFNCFSICCSDFVKITRWLSINKNWRLPRQVYPLRVPQLNCSTRKLIFYYVQTCKREPHNNLCCSMCTSGSSFDFQTSSRFLTCTWTHCYSRFSTCWVCANLFKLVWNPRVCIALMNSDVALCKGKLLAKKQKNKMPKKASFNSTVRVRQKSLPLRFRILLPH